MSATKSYFWDRFHLKLMFVWIVLFSVIPFQLSSAAGPLKIYAVNYPLKYFAERIGGMHVKVYFPAPADVDPVYWTPDIASIAVNQKADLILLNGAGYAKWVSKVSLLRSKAIDTSRKFKNRYIYTEATTHNHGPEGEHAHESLALTTWLDFDLAAGQAQGNLEGIYRKQPELMGLFQKNYEQLEQDSILLDRKIKALVSKGE